MRKDEILRTIEGDGAPVVVFRRGDYLGLRMAENAHLIQGYRHRFRPLDFRAEYLEGHLAASMMFTAPKRVLCLGLGVGAIPHLLNQLFPDVHIDAVEVNDTVIHAAKSYFGLEQLGSISCSVMCAAEYVRRYRGPAYDLVYVDCYDAHGIPEACQSSEFISGVSQLISERGGLIANLIPKRVGVATVYAKWSEALGTGWVLPGDRKSNVTLVLPQTNALGIKHALGRVRSRNRPPVPLNLERPLMGAVSTERYTRGV